MALDEATALGVVIDSRFFALEEKVRALETGGPVSEPPTTEPGALPERVRQAASIWIKGKPGIVLENLIVPGRLTLKDCPGAVVRNVWCAGNADATQWGHLNLVDSPNATVEDYVSTGNVRGHGIHLAGNYGGTIIRRADCSGAQEDGIQTAQQALDGKVLVHDSRFWGNKENGVDLKSGTGTFVNCYIQTKASPRHEPIVLQDFHVKSKFTGCLIVDTPNTTSRVKALASVYVGRAEFVDCRFGVIPGRVDKWFRDNAQNPIDMAAVLAGVDQPDLLITGATHVSHDMRA